MSPVLDAEGREAMLIPVKVPDHSRQEPQTLVCKISKERKKEQLGSLNLLGI